MAFSPHCQEVMRRRLDNFFFVKYAFQAKRVLWLRGLPVRWSDAKINCECSSSSREARPVRSWRYARRNKHMLLSPGSCMAKASKILSAPGQVLFFLNINMIQLTELMLLLDDTVPAFGCPDSSAHISSSGSPPLFSLKLCTILWLHRVFRQDDASWYEKLTYVNDHTSRDSSTQLRESWRTRKLLSRERTHFSKI